MKSSDGFLQPKQHLFYLLFQTENKKLFSELCEKYYFFKELFHIMLSKYE